MRNQDKNRSNESNQKIEIEKPKTYNPLNNRYFLTIFSLYTAFAVIYLAYRLTQFRQDASQIQIWVVPFDQLFIKTAILFFSIMTIKTFCEQILGRLLKKYVHPRYYGTGATNIQMKGLFLGRCLYGWISNLTISIYMFYLFRYEQWFPSVMGGCGSCQKMANAHPHSNFSQSNKEGIVNVLAFLVATFFYENCQLLLIKKGQFEFNFGDVLLHHFMAFFVTLFAGLYNAFGVVVTSAILFDISDFYQHFTRFIHYSKFSAKYPKMYMVAESLCLFFWWLTRGAFLFFCHINPIYQSAQGTSTTEFGLYYVHIILLSLLGGLLGLNAFWTGIKIQKIKSKIEHNFEQSRLWKQGSLKQQDKNSEQKGKKD